MFLDFQRNVKIRINNLRIIFHGCLMFIVPLHCCQNLTSFTLDVQQWLRMDHTRGSWTELQWSLREVCELISMDWGLNFCYSFYDFLIRHFKKNVKSHVFWNLQKRKIRILELCAVLNISYCMFRYRRNVCLLPRGHCWPWIMHRNYGQK